MNTNNQLLDNRLSTDKILIKSKEMVLKKHLIFPASHLDIGSGSGELISILRNHMDIRSQACDYTIELMQLQDVHVDVVDLNLEKLPYQNNTFDVVTCTEVIEHLEHYRETIREVFRVLKENGTFVVSTPNILNLKSRVRFLIYGFYNLFGPLHFKESKLHSSGGHITPIGLFYLIHSLIDAGFHDIDIQIDKKQSTSIFWLIFLYLPIKIFSILIHKSEVEKYKTIDASNENWVKKMNSLDVLLGRTIIIGAKKN